MYPIPKYVIDYWKQNPDVTGAELARATGIPERSGSRYRRYLMENKAYPVETVPLVRSKHLEELVDIEEEFDPFEFFERAPKLIAMQQAHDPIITHDTFTINTDKPIGIIFVSCIHLGSRYTAYPEFRKIYEQALNIENLYWGSLGDDVEGFLSSFPDVKAIQDQLIDPRKQIACLEALLTPMAETGRLIFGAGSQHGGQWQNKKIGRSDVKQLYVSLGVPYFDGVGYIRLNVGEQTYYIAVAHELPGNSMWNPNQAQAKAARFRFPNASIIVNGDKHTFSYQYSDMFMDEYLIGNRLSPSVLLLQAGTAKTGPDIFAVEHGFPRGSLGWPIAILHPHEYRVEVTPYLDRAKEMLCK